LFLNANTFYNRKTSYPVSILNNTIKNHLLYVSFCVLFITTYITLSLSIFYVARFTYLVHGPAIAKNEIDGSFNVAFLEVMSACIVAKGVLCTVETASGEVCFVAGYAKRHRLPSLHPRHWCRCCVLHVQSVVLIVI